MKIGQKARRALTGLAVTGAAIAASLSLAAPASAAYDNGWELALRSGCSPVQGPGYAKINADEGHYYEWFARPNEGSGNFKTAVLRRNGWQYAFTQEFCRDGWTWRSYRYDRNRPAYQELRHFYYCDGGGCAHLRSEQTGWRDY